MWKWRCEENPPSKMDGQWPRVKYSEGIETNGAWPDAISEYNCVDHIIHNMMLDAFKNCPGMLAVLEKCKEMAAYTNRSGKAKKILKKQNKLLGKIFYTLK